MPDLTSKQRAYLRSMANRLKPIVHVGSDGVTEAILTSVEETFANRELIKVKILESAPNDARFIADHIVASLEDVHVAQTIGRTVVLYRPHPKSPEIKLPG